VKRIAPGKTSISSGSFARIGSFHSRGTDTPLPGGTNTTKCLIAFYAAALLCVVPAVGYGLTRELQYKPLFRKMIDVEDTLYNSNTRCDLINSEIRVRSVLTWYGGSKGWMDTADIVVESQGTIVGRGKDQNEMLLTSGESTPVTFVAADHVTDEQLNDFDEVKSLKLNFAKLREKVQNGPFECKIVLLRGPFTLLREETRQLLSRSTVEFLKQIYGR
jgi:hypothetical protein